MKNTSRKPYIYKVTSFETGQYYIGSQCSGKKIGVNYFTSSTNKVFVTDFKNYGDEKYKIEIIKSFIDPDECGRAENYIIRNYMLKKDGLCLNKFYCCSGKKVFSAVGIHHAPWNKGIPSSKKGIPLSEEVKRKISRGSTRRIKISIEGTVFNSLTEASKYYNVSDAAIRSWVKNKKGHPSPHRIKISIEGKVFNSRKEAAKYYNVSDTAISYWIKTGNHNTVCIEK